MADVNVTPSRMGFNGGYYFGKATIDGNATGYKEEYTVLSMQATSMATGDTDVTYVDFSDDDGKTVMLITASGANSNITIYKGDGIQGAGEDLVIAVPNGKTVPVTIESGRYKIMSGAKKGCVKIKASATATILAVMLP